MMPEELLHCLGLEQNSPKHIWAPCQWTTRSHLALLTSSGKGGDVSTDTD